VSQENVEIVRNTVDGWNRGDFDAVKASAHRQVEYVSGVKGLVEGDETAFRGRAGVRRFWDEWHSVWDLTLEGSEIRDLGDTVVAFCSVTTRGKTSGVELNSPVAYVFEFEEGLGRRVHAYLSREQALKAVGLSE
jgi:ketosteroid isomerase-like protein